MSKENEVSDQKGDACHTLIAEYCRLVGISQVEAVAAGHPFSVDGTDFRLACVEDVTPEILFLFCDFGEVPVEHESEVFRDLLQGNLVRYDGHSPSFALCPETNLVLCVARLRAARTTARELHANIVRMSVQAQEWKAKLCSGQFTSTFDAQLVSLEPSGRDRKRRRRMH